MVVKRAGLSGACDYHTHFTAPFSSLSLKHSQSLYLSLPHPLPSPPVPWSLTLVALKHYVFKGSDVQLTFRPLGPDGPAPVLTIEPPAKDG